MKVADLLKSKASINVDLNGGAQSQKGFITVNSRDLKGVDIVCDLESYPWPFPTDSINLLIASHLVEKINPHKMGFVKFMDEAWRVLKPGGQFMISTPYPGSYQFYQDPTNINPCNEATFCYFDPLEQMSKGELYKVYRPKPWHILKFAFIVEGNLEVLLEKRLDDPSYCKE